MGIKNIFHINGFAFSLASKQRLGATWKWPIVSFATSLVAKEKAALQTHVTSRSTDKPTGR